MEFELRRTRYAGPMTLNFVFKVIENSCEVCGGSGSHGKTLR